MSQTSAFVADPLHVYRQQLRALASELHSIHSELLGRLDKLSPQHQDVYLARHHQMIQLTDFDDQLFQLQTNQNRTLQPVNLMELLFRLSSTAQLVADLPEGSLRPLEHDNVYLLIQNSARPARAAVNASVYEYLVSAEAALERSGFQPFSLLTASELDSPLQPKWISLYRWWCSWCLGWCLSACSCRQ